MRQITPPTPANSQLLYFTSPSITADGRTLVTISDRTGQPNVFAQDLSSGGETQLTANAAGSLRSYVYFDGLPHCGLGRASISLDAARGFICFIQDDVVWRADLSGQHRALAALPAGLVTAFTHISSDGQLLCVPTIDERAFADYRQGAGRLIDQRVQADGLSSLLRIFDTASGRMVACEPVPRGWVTHVQFHPTDSSKLLYNHEWAANCGYRRMWLWDGHTHRALRTMADGRRPDDWVCHEVWSADGRHIIYHGGLHEGAMFVGRLNPVSGQTIEIPLPNDWRQYGHFMIGPTDRIVTDGYYRQPDDPTDGCGRWIALLDVDWTSRRLTWTPLARHGSSWTSQDAHPHPIFDPSGEHVYFTSDRHGRRAIYQLDCQP